MPVVGKLSLKMHQVMLVDRASDVAVELAVGEVSMEQQRRRTRNRENCTFHRRIHLCPLERLELRGTLAQ